MNEEIEELEPVEGEEAPLSAEEIFEQHKAEIDAAFEEKGFFRRMGDMFSGLSKPKSSPEYKLARVELQRLAAPLLAILLPTLGVIVLIVVTAIQGQTKEVIQIEVQKIQDDEEELVEDKPEEIEETPPDEVVDVQVDTPVVGPVTDVVTPNVTPTTEPISVKPAPQDSVALIKSPIQMKSMAGSRNPGMRGQFLSGGTRYGDANTEAAVMKALRWLKKTQKSDGSWSCGASSIAGAGFGILTFLAHGETPGSKEFGNTVERAMQYLIDSQVAHKDGGATYKGSDGHEYATLIATYALCEAYGMTRNPNAKIAAEKGMQRIIDNQSPTGGWDYGMVKTSTRDDMSYEGWALQALKAGKMAGLHPSGLEECIKKAIKCLKTRNFRNGGFNYTAGGGATGLTATGCLCMQLLGYTAEPEVKAALDTMRGWLPVFESKARLEAGGPTPGSNPQYYCYYAAQCKYQAGMCPGAKPENLKSWQDWNVAMKKLYPTCMVDDGTIEGLDGKPKPVAHWVFEDPTCGGKNNTTMATCLCALQLMVYYRYLPTTQIDKSAASAEKSEAETRKSDKKKSQEVEVEVDI